VSQQLTQSLRKQLNSRTLFNMMLTINKNARRAVAVGSVAVSSIAVAQCQGSSISTSPVRAAHLKRAEHI
jgi:hypothetical protein